MFLLIAAAASAQTAEGDSLFPTYMVDAEVLNVVDDGKTVSAELKVFDVLYGPDSLSNLTFRITANSSGEGGVGALALYPPLEKGERGIWPVRLNKEGTLYVERVALLKTSLIDLPCRWNREKKRCEEVSALAKTMRAVSKADPAKRQKMVSALVGNEDALTQRWAKYARSKLTEEQGSKDNQK
jgi:hypothetical protein